MEFTVTHSFNCMTGFEANRLIDCRVNKLESAGDKAKHQIKESRDAQGYVNTGQLTLANITALPSSMARRRRKRLQMATVYLPLVN